jgi:hypothetical protein
MEYLMTYGWAILIIAVVLGALFQLGVFNANNFAPKAPPGACQVFRPNGPGTTSFINLEGECQGELPEYVAQFNGQNSYIITRNISNSQQTLTVSAWVYPVQSGGNRGIVGQLDNGNEDWNLKISGTNYDFVVYGIKDNTFGPLLLRTWSYITATFNKGSVYLYVNGVLTATYQESTLLNTSKQIYIGYVPNDAPPLFFNGSIANVQIYNTSLTAQQIQQLYQEGIDGRPLPNAGLVGWWPLNGNANDYSGNGNNGVPTDVLYAPQRVVKPSLLYSLGDYGTNFNGQNSKINVSVSQSLLSPNKTQEYTICTGFSLKSNTQETFLATYADEIRIGLNAPNTFIVDWGTHTDYTYPAPLNTNAAYQVCTDYNKGTGILYLNGNPIATTTGLASVSIAPNTPLLGLGYEIWQKTDFKYTNGTMWNVQFYNTSLSAQQIQQLYYSNIPPSADVTIPLSWVT